jgi:hypothetical protein
LPAWAGVVAFVVVALASVVGAGGTAEAATAPPARPVVVVFVRDSDWAMLPPTLGSWATAQLSLHSATNGEREMDSYLSIGKGGRTSGLGSAVGVGDVTDHGAGIRLLDWPAFARHDRRLRFPGHIGELGQVLADHHVSTELVISSDAEVAGVLADRQGVVPRAAYGGALEVALARARGVQLVVVETDYTAVPSVLEAAGDGCVVVASSSTPEHSAHLGGLAVSPACGLGTGRLRSPTTRQTDFVVLGDLAPTTLGLLGIEGAGRFEGNAVVPAAGHRSIASLVAEDRRATVTRHAERPFTGLLVAGSLVVLLAAATTDPSRRRGVAAAVLALPVATLLIDVVPWWRLGVAAGLGATVGCAALLAAAAWKATGGRPLAVTALLAAVTVVVTGIDAGTGGRLQLNSALANNAIGAGRFTGMGNVPYGFFVAGCLVLAALALARWDRRGVPVAVALGAVAVVVDGAPMLGADVGGILATVPAFSVLLATWRRPLPLRRLAPLLGGGFLVVAGFGAYDLSRPVASQTHLARALSDGAFGATAVRRELGALHSFQGNPFLGVVVVAGLGLWLERRALRASRPLWVALGALTVGAALGTFLNDSGVAVAGAMAAVAWPAYAVLLEVPLRRGSPPATVARRIPTPRRG